MYKRMLKMLHGEKGEVYVGEGVKIVLCVVLGAAILAGLVLMANKIILPKTSTYIKALFSSADGSAAYLEWDSNGRPDAYGTIKTAFIKKLVGDTEWHRKKEAGIYDEIGDEATFKIFDELINTGGLTITIKDRSVFIPGDDIVEEAKVALAEGRLDSPEQMQFYQDFIDAYETVNSPEVKRKAGTMAIELERKIDQVEENVYSGYIVKYGGSEESLENYIDSLSDEEVDALDLEWQEKVIQGYRDAYISVGAKYGVEFTEEELNEMFS